MDHFGKTTLRPPPFAAAFGRSLLKVRSIGREAASIQATTCAIGVVGSTWCCSTPHRTSPSRSAAFVAADATFSLIASTRMHRPAPLRSDSSVRPSVPRPNLH